jgi:hypothetical protein
MLDRQMAAGVMPKMVSSYRQKFCLRNGMGIHSCFIKNAVH